MIRRSSLLVLVGAALLAGAAPLAAQTGSRSAPP